MKNEELVIILRKTVNNLFDRAKTACISQQIHHNTQEIDNFVNSVLPYWYLRGRDARQRGFRLSDSPFNGALTSGFGDVCKEIWAKGWRQGDQELEALQPDLIPGLPAPRVACRQEPSPEDFAEHPSKL